MQTRHVILRLGMPPLQTVSSLYAERDATMQTENIVDAQEPTTVSTMPTLIAWNAIAMETIHFINVLCMYREMQ